MWLLRASWTKILYTAPKRCEELVSRSACNFSYLALCKEALLETGALDHGKARQAVGCQRRRSCATGVDGP
ncbi:hypothetical protein BRN96_12000, partial [Xanthomonas oryzae pv. oryzae]